MPPIILSVGNAIVDLIAEVDEDLVSRNGFAKGGMTLVDASESARRRALVSDPVAAPGGSAANTAACLASLGAVSLYIGKVGADDNGRYFRRGMSDMNVGVLHNEDHPSVPTAKCLALVTPDGERTMSTFLGACTRLSPADVDADAIRHADLVFVEGYLLDSVSSVKAVENILDVAAEEETGIAISLSDAGCVARNHPAFRAITGSRACRVIIANEREIRAFHDTEDTETAIELCRSTPDKVFVITLGSHGAAITSGGSVDRVPAVRVDHIVDLVGAGDAFAAGFLFGYADRRGLVEAAEIGANCAAVVISGRGARPDKSLAQFVARPVAGLYHRDTPSVLSV